MQLRKLRPEDAPLMLEWMHDPDVVAHLGANFAEKTIQDCSGFIANSLTDQENLHLAVVDEHDVYMGTVSLKHIHYPQETAEFAITVRAAAMGRGFSRYAMEHILSMGITELGLKAIYWCVSPENKRAVRFYDKQGYHRTTLVPERLRSCYTPQQLQDLVWYVYPAIR